MSGTRVVEKTRTETIAFALVSPLRPIVSIDIAKKLSWFILCEHRNQFLILRVLKRFEIAQITVGGGDIPISAWKVV